MKTSHSVSVVLDKNEPEIEKVLKSIPKEHERITVLDKPSSDADLLDFVSFTAPDVVLLNVTHAELSKEYDLISDIRAATPRTQVVAVVEKEHPDQAGEALLAGAIGYLYDDQGVHLKAVDAIHSAAHRRGTLDSDVAQHLMKSDASRFCRHRYLTRQERRILRRIGKGHSARQLHVAQEDLERHVGSILLKIHRHKKIIGRRKRTNHHVSPQLFTNSESIFLISIQVWLLCLNVFFVGTILAEVRHIDWFLQLS